MLNKSPKGLVYILSTLVLFSVAALVFLAYTLSQLSTLLTKGGSAVGSALVLQDILINVRHVESGNRGYVITGDSAFLERYAQSAISARQDLRTIQRNDQLNISDQQLKRIVALTEAKLVFADSVVATYDTEGAEAARALITSGLGLETMVGLEKEINGVTSAGLKDIGPLQRSAVGNIQRALVVAAALGILVLAACAAVIRYFQRAILHERALENSKSEFLSLASHQLRTPATNVKQYVGMVLDGYLGDITEQQRKALTVAYKNNESEISIMNNLLDVAKLDLSRIQLDKKPVNIAGLASQVVTEYKPQAREHQQEIELIGSTNVMASVDGSYIKGVIENLVDNAIKYSKEGSKVTVKVSREDDEVVIMVKDQGLGIRKRDFYKLFNKFSRLANEFSASSQGSGLGLYWVKQIVELHSGRITVKSREGKGSTFKIKLPIRPSKEKDQA